MATKQYVNIVGGDPKKHEGRGVLLQLKANETKPGASEDQPVFVFIKPGGSNEDVKWLPGNDRAEAYHTKPPHRLSGTIKAMQFEIAPQVGICGGDKFDFEYGKKEDGSDKKGASGKDVEVWRKIFFKVGHMKGMKTHDVMGLQGKFNPVFIELEQDGGDTEIPHESFVDASAPYIAKLQALAPKPKHADQTLWIVCVDRIFDRGHKDIAITHDPKSFPRSKCFKAKFEKKVSGKTVQYFTWPDSKAWLRGGKIRMFDAKGALRAEQPAGPYVFPIADGPHKQHPEGLLASTLGFDLTQFPGIDDWLEDDANKLTIDLDVFNLESSSAGMALEAGLVCATRNAKLEDLDPIADGTMLHEMGHALGQVLRWIHSYTPDTADVDDKVQNDKWYTNVNGGVGNHCSTGSSMDSNNKFKAGGKPCVMFHGTARNTTDFCDKCQQVLKRARLTKLGRVSVWGNSGWA